MATPRYTIMREEISMVNALHYGDTRTSQTILDALLDIGATPTVLLLADDDDGVWTLDISLTIPANIILQIPFGVTVTGPGDLTLLGGVMALRSDWFQGSGVLIWLTGAALFQVNALQAGPTQLGSLVLDTPLPVSEGGTGARDAPQARINLGIVPGADVQPWDATLATIAGLDPDVDDYIYFTGPDQAAKGIISTLGRTWLTHVAPSQMRTTMQLGDLAPLSLVTTPYLTDKHVTYAKLQDVAAGRLLGNSGASPATVGEISIGAGLTLTGGVLAQAGGAVTGTGAANRMAFWSSASVQSYNEYVRINVDDPLYPGIHIGTGTGSPHPTATGFSTSTHVAFGGGLQVWGNMGIAVARDVLYALRVGGNVRFDAKVGLGALYTNSLLTVEGSAAVRRLYVGGDVSTDATEIFSVWGPGTTWSFLGATFFGMGGIPDRSAGQPGFQVWVDTTFKGSIGIGNNPQPGYRVWVSGHAVLASGSNLGIGITPSYQLHVATNAGIPGGAWVNTTSSRDLKYDIRPLLGALALVRQLQPRQWEWTGEHRELDETLPGTQIGFVMEEVLEVVPAWAPLNLDGETRGLAMRGLDACLVGAVQELSIDVYQRLEQLEQRLAALESPK